jgi:hypothetical protein
MFGKIASVKRCSRCERWLELSAFTPNRTRRDGLQTFCRECQRSYMRWHYDTNREYYLAKALRSNSKRRTGVRAMLHELKSVPCASCGTAYPPWVMEFDHVRGQKLFNVSEGLMRGAKELLAEAAKCEIVCSNCHQDRTWQRQHMRP